MHTFFSTSDKIQDIIKSFNLTKTLFVSSIIIGEAHTGKKILAQYLFPHATIVSGKNQKEVEDALEQYDEIIITNFELLSNQNSLNFTNKRIIATANYIANMQLIDSMFAFIYTIPPLKERLEDTEYLKEIFIKEALEIFMMKKVSLNTENILIDLSQNSKSLKKSVFSYVAHSSINAREIQSVLHAYFIKNLQGENAYKEYIGLYEKPLIEAGLQKFESQLKLSEILGINRNTLRKKIHAHNIF